MRYSTLRGRHICPTSRYRSWNASGTEDLSHADSCHLFSFLCADAVHLSPLRSRTGGVLPCLNTCPVSGGNSCPLSRIPARSDLLCLSTNALPARSHATTSATTSQTITCAGYRHTASRAPRLLCGELTRRLCDVGRYPLGAPLRLGGIQLRDLPVARSRCTSSLSRRRGVTAHGGAFACTSVWALRWYRL